jgi:hypothetical protein
LGSVLPAFQTPCQFGQVLVQVLFVLRVTDSVDSGGGVLAQSPEGLGEHLPIQQTGQTPEAMLRLLSRLCSQCGQGA